jgi:hypothetical protein
MPSTHFSIPGTFSQAEEQKDTLTLSWTVVFYGFLSVIFLWRVLYLFLTPFDLVPDEAYYCDWSRQLDWSYYTVSPRSWPG